MALRYRMSQVRSFFRELHAQASAVGMVDMNLLMLDDRPAAFIYGYHYKGCVYGLRRGFDADISRSGLGSVLLWNTIKDSAQRGDSIYDMGIGSIGKQEAFSKSLASDLPYKSFPCLRFAHTVVAFWPMVWKPPDCGLFMIQPGSSRPAATYWVQPA